MNIGELKKVIANLPDDTPVCYEDPNYGGALSDIFRCKMTVDTFYICVPFISDVNDE